MAIEQKGASSKKSQEVIKLQLKNPITTPSEVYTAIEMKRHRASMQVAEEGVEVLVVPAPNKPASNYHHFLVPWGNINAVYYAVSSKENPVGQ